MKHRRHAFLLPIALALVALPAWSAAAAQTAAAGPGTASEAYGYFRTVEGRSLLSSREAEETRDLEINLPLLAGDAVQVGAGSRVEAVLADGSVARLEAGSEIVFDQLARSPDSPGVTTTRLVLLAGEMQLRVPEDSVRSTAIEIESGNARVYLIRGGSFWIGVAGGDETRLVVREGAAEVLTDDGSILVQAGEEVEIDGAFGVRTRVARAGYERGIERWARDLERAAYVADYGPVEKPLRYAAAPLARSGSWVRVDGRVAWRPRVRYGWRPFHDGYWFYTPSGLSWVAHEPWGWVTAHYGTWDYLPSYGWCWFPGSVYSPAWVYWYWGPSHAAWIPYGYYARYYGPHFGLRFGHHGWGLRFGVYGYASGGWSVFSDWTFCPLSYFGRRGGRYYYRTGSQLARERRALAVPRGIITTDTRGLDRAVWTRPYEARKRLGEVRRSSFVQGYSKGGDDLPDVSSFVARRRELPTDVREIVRAGGEADRRPALGKIGAPAGRGDGGGLVAGRSSASSRSGRSLVGPAAAPGEVARRDTLRGAGPVFDKGGERTGSREHPPAARRPTHFERAPTSVYSTPAGDRAAAGRKAPATRTASPPSRGTFSISGQPAPGHPLSGESRSVAPGKRPTDYERAPTSVYSRPGGSARPQAGRTEAAAPSRVPSSLYERGPAADPRSRAVTPIYSRPDPRGGGEAAGRVPSAVRPPARRVVESVRSRGPSAGPARPSAPRIQPRPAPSPPPRVSSPPRSSGSRLEAGPSRSSGSRVQSSSRPGGQRTSGASRSKGKKDD